MNKLLRWSILTLLLLAGFKPYATADSIVVTTTEDQFGTNPAECSLREAIQAINIHHSFDGCMFDSAWTVYSITLASGTYSITRDGVDDDNTLGDFDILPDYRNIIFITGIPGMTILDGGGLDRVLDLKYGEESNVVLYDLIIRNGHSPDCGGAIRNEGILSLSSIRIEGNRAVSGGGICNNQNLTINSSVLTGNSNDTAQTPGGGGAIYNLGSLSASTISIVNNHAGSASDVSGTISGGNGGAILNAGTAEIHNSTISGNSSGDCLLALQCTGGQGGGIYNSGTLNLFSSTISGNKTGDSIGGLSIFGGGVYNAHNFSVTDSTIVDNTIGSGDSGNRGGGIYNEFAKNVFMHNSILALNESGSLGDDCSGVIYSFDYNLIQHMDESCTLIGTTTHDLPVGTDPLIMELAYYGGPFPYTHTHMLGRNSPAIDAGGDCPNEDQRYYTRPMDGDLDGNAVCDIGSVEVYWPILFFLPMVLNR
jgi:CSLREA domain-containing protein